MDYMYVLEKPLFTFLTPTHPQSNNSMLIIVDFDDSVSQNSTVHVF